MLGVWKNVHTLCYISNNNYNFVACITSCDVFFLACLIRGRRNMEIEKKILKLGQESMSTFVHNASMYSPNFSLPAALFKLQDKRKVLSRCFSSSLNEWSNSMYFTAYNINEELYSVMYLIKWHWERDPSLKIL